jgi:hypothetical protein
MKLPMRKVLALLAVAVMLLTACGREGGEEELNITSAQEGAEATATPGAEETAKATKAPADDPADEATPSPTAAAATDAPAAPAPSKAPEGQYNDPKVGTYTYDIEGEANDPLNPTAPPEKYKGEATTEISRSGDVTTREDTTSEQPGRFTLRTKRESTRVLLLSFKAETAAGDFSCELDPPLVIIKFPVKPEKFPTQTFKGQGNACSGKLDIEVLRQEAAKDASGKSWQTWVAKVRQEVKSGQLNQVTNQTRWVSPDLGIEIKGEQQSSGQFGTQKFEANGSAVLKDYP